ncbi:response regulator transcription factor [Terrabacter sp. Root181]|uniref:response regulator transcription factor n=1 Tax=Terrabacter sp. Root181 TaxID=1736484 RepID=UPI0006F4ABB0|nr:response regulator transcription factor [Terrabacter sp. Root181]KRB47405.1 LuxR family transcriptional regulator [Terrabacter sp. Root181]
MTEVTTERPTDRPTRVMIVDDQALVRAGFRMVLDAEPDIDVVAECADGLAALDALPGRDVDVVLMDIRMPRLDGIEATRRVVERGATPKVLVLTTFDLDEYVYAALRAGAAGFLLKDAGPSELLSAIRAVHTGDAVVAPGPTRRLLDRFLPVLATPVQPAGIERLDVLTEREREVLEAVGKGLNNAEIAASFFVAEATVKTHIGRILAKLGLRDRVQMVVLAYETGLVRVGDG